MAILKRRRLYIWLIKAYFKKWGKTIFFSFIIGLIAFFLLRSSFSYIVSKIPFIQHQEIGLVGAYTVDSLPDFILRKISIGLTTVNEDGTVGPGIAKSWQIKDGGKTYVFNLTKQISFSDKTLLTARELNYDFKDVVLEKPDKYTLIFKLKNPYVPFLTTVSQPIYKKNFIGLGEYKIRSIKLNGSFVQSIVLENIKNKNIITYQFYPTEEALKLAFVLGEVSEIINIQNTVFKNTDMKDFKNTNIVKNIDYSTLVSIFYNTQDSLISDKNLRKALNYSIPDSFSEGERNYTPYSPNIWINKGEVNDRAQDLERAQQLFDEIKDNASKSAKFKIELQALEKHSVLAQKIKAVWSKFDIDVSIEIVDQRPDNFQIFLGEFTIPKDPDQYLLWHSDQPNNITRYKNLRIDKLLEDGRITADKEKRRKIYLDFQKYLLDDVPASFLFNPYVFNIERK